MATLWHLLVLVPIVAAMIAPPPPAPAPNVNNSVFEESQQVHPMGDYPQCEWIPVTVCQGLGYNMTAMPNLIGHRSLLDAEIMVNEMPLQFPHSHLPFPRVCEVGCETKLCDTMLFPLSCLTSLSAAFGFPLNAPASEMPDAMDR